MPAITTATLTRRHIRWVRARVMSGSPLAEDADVALAPARGTGFDSLDAQDDEEREASIEVARERCAHAYNDMRKGVG